MSNCYHISELKMFTKISLLVIFLLAVDGHRLVDLYGPLYEAQRGPLLQEQNGSSVSDECVNDFYNLLFNKTSTLLPALDAFGKPGAGFLYANWAWYGHFTECSNLDDYKYCLLTLNITEAIVPEDLRATVKPVIQWGVCAPKKCTTDDVHNSLEILLDFLHLSNPGLNLVNVSSVRHASSCVEKPVVQYGAGFYACIVFCTFVGILLIGGSLVDIYEKRKTTGELGLSINSGDITPLVQNEENGDVRSNGTVYPLYSEETHFKKILRKILGGTRLLLLDCALNRNLKKLMKINESNERNIDCLNGIRVLSMFWVILGHIFFFPVTYGGLFNYPDLVSWSKKFPFQIILNAYFSVDSFFFLSGLLVCYLTLLKLEKKNGHIPWHWFYIHRYIRLTPVMLITILIWMYIAPYTLWGPKATIMAERPFCPENWWANVLYIQNFYPAKFGTSCIGWTWYLANDMQFFIISPLIIYALYKVPWVGFGLVGALMSISFAVTGGLMAHYDFTASPSTQIATRSSADYASIVYQKPYVRIPPYLVGMILGYIMYRLRDRRVVIPRIFLALGWVIATGVAIATVFGLYGDYTDHPLEKAGNIIYEMLSRFAWGVFLAWVVISCKYGQPGWINDILSWNLWVPLSRVTYTAYLLHPIVITTFLGNFGLPYYSSLVLQSYFFCGVVLLSYSCAMIFSLAVEFPLANIEKHFLPKV